MKKIEVKISESKKNDQEVSILFENELTIQTIKDIKNSIEETICRYKIIHIHVSNVSSMDLTFIQLIEALKEKCKKNKIELDIKLSIKNEIENLLINTGFNNLLKTVN